MEAKEATMAVSLGLLAFAVLHWALLNPEMCHVAADTAVMIRAVGRC